MRKYRVIVLLLTMLLLVGCKEDSEPQYLTPQVFVNEVQQLAQGKVFLSGSYDPYGKEQVTTVIFHYGTTQAMEQTIQATLHGRTATAILEGLDPSTTYYYCMEIGNGLDSRMSDPLQFTTPEAQDEPETPEEPDEPTTPEEPDEPTNPEEPSEPDNKEEVKQQYLKNANLIQVVEKQLGRAFQKEADGTVSLSKVYNQRLVEMVTKLDLDDKDDPTICDEIAYFTSLRVLLCSRNDIASLDLSKNLMLEELHCWGKDVYINDNGEEEWKGHSGKMNDLKLPQTPTLRKIIITGHMLTAIDVSKYPNLEYLECGFGDLVELDVSHNPALKELCCQKNVLASLDITKNVELTRIDCYDNYIKVLDFSNQKKLVSVDCGGTNQLSEINLSKNTNLERLLCYNQPQLTSIDVSQFPKLYYLDMNHCNKLGALDLSHNAKLEHLTCIWGSLTALDLSHNPMLKHVECEGNQLTNLDVSNNPELIYLRCYQNQMTELDVSMISANADIMAGNQHSSTGSPIYLTLYVNKAQYEREPNTGPYYMGKWSWMQGQQDRVNVVLKE